MYTEKTYRYRHGGQNRIEVVYKNTDIFLSSDAAFKKDEVRELIKKYYSEIETYIARDPRFWTSLSPVSVADDAPSIVKAMADAGRLSGVGPFSAVAGAVAQFVGHGLSTQCSELIIENGGDLFLKIHTPKTIGLYAGEGSALNNFSLDIKPLPESFGIAASSGTMGHSLSLGNAELVVIVAEDAIVADTFATVVCNQIKKKKDAPPVIDVYKKNPALKGIGVYCEEELYVWNIKLSLSA